MKVELSRTHLFVFLVLFSLQTVGLWLTATRMPRFSPPADARYLPLAPGMIGVVLDPVGWLWFVIQLAATSFLTAVIVGEMSRAVRRPS